MPYALTLFYVIRVNRDNSDTHAATTFRGALELANPDPGAVLHYFTVVCGDEGEARLARKPWRSLYRRFSAADARSLEQRVIAVWSNVARNHETHAQGLERITSEVFGSPTFYRLPQFAQERIKGVNTGAREFISHNLVEWRVMLDGKLTKGADVPSGRWGETSGEDGRFVWKDKPENVF